MAISDDTAALVAAQLTTAWAMRVGPVGAKGTPVKPHEATIAEMYTRFRNAVAEVDIRKK